MWENNDGNVFDYIKWRGDLTFNQSGLNVVDALIFSILTYVDYSLLPDIEGPVPLKKYGMLLKRMNPDRYCTWIMEQSEFAEFFSMVSESRRFSDVKVYRYVEQFDEEKGQQLAAMTFLYNDDEAFVAFRGTDNTMTGWKEDFSMSFLSETSGQIAAKDYVNEIASKLDCEFSVGGHSKGGNFAVWAAVKCDEKYKDRISYVYNNDGPGFSKEFINSKEYDRMDSKILSFVPESSIVGMMMSYCKFVTIKSTNVSVLQHNPFSWKINGRGFVYDVERTRSGKKLAAKLNEVMECLTEDQKAELVNDIFEALDSESIKTTDELKKYVIRHTAQLVPKVKRIMERFKEDE